MKCKTTKKTQPIEKSVKISNTLEKKGRVQFFYHSKDSEFPIRDITDSHHEGKKTEPHIEIGAENFLAGCYQKNIKGFIRSKEKYLFLITNYSGKNKEYQGKRYIVGYIIKQFKGKGLKKNSEFVRGKTVLFDFKDALLTKNLGWSNFVRVKKVYEDDTKKIFKHFKRMKPLKLDDCIKEINRLDPEYKTCHFRDNPHKCPEFENCKRFQL